MEMKLGGWAAASRRGVAVAMRSMQALQLGVAMLVLGCGTTGPSRSDGEAGDGDSVSFDGETGGDGEVDGGAEVDATPEADGVEGGEEEGTVLPPVEDVPGCGNGVLETGEECDDGNRLNGDGCDWVCHVGDGDPPPDPDPDVPDYAPSGEPLPVGDPATTEVGYVRVTDVPLAWTGEEFATAYAAGVGVIRFRRFDEVGRQLDAEWSYDEGAAADRGHDLVWNGDSFGLFFVDQTRGILYLRLDRDGKPHGEPVVVESDASASVPAAAWTGDDFVLAWIAGPLEADQAVRVKSVDLDGTAGPTTEIVATHASAVGVAAGDDGGVGVGFALHPGGGEFRLSFVRLDPSLTEPTYSGVLTGRVRLGPQHQRFVVFSAGSYAVAWHYCELCAFSGGDTELCVARYSSAGDLEGPPVCSPLGDGVVLDGSALALAAGDHGYLAVMASALGEGSPEAALRYARLDGNGVMLSPSPGELTTPGEDYLQTSYPFDVAWDGNGFGVLWSGEGTGGVDHSALFFRFLRAVSGP